MKNKVTILFLFFSLNTQSQVEFKANTILALFGAPDISAEFILQENIGLEGKVGANFNSFNVLNPGYKKIGLSFLVNGRYYFFPNTVCDHFFIGVYSKVKNITYKSSSDILEPTEFNNFRLAIGFLGGWKYTSKNERLTFETASGVGRSIINKYPDLEFTNILDDFLDLDLVISLSIGYRFWVK